MELILTFSKINLLIRVHNYLNKHKKYLIYNNQIHFIFIEGIVFICSCCFIKHHYAYVLQLIE